jgi:hypothetical protein
MVCNPDSQITVWNPTACQIDMNMMAGIAAVGLFSQSVPWTTLKVAVCSRFTKYRVRKKLTPRILALTSRASSSANPDCKGHDHDRAVEGVAQRLPERRVAEQPGEVLEPDDLCRFR